MAAAYLDRMGERIRARRDELGFSRSDVARQLPGKTNENAVYRWEKGQHRPNDDTLEALAGVLQTSVSYFLTDEPDKTATPDPFGGSMNGVSIESKRLEAIEAKLDRLLEFTQSVDATRLLAVLQQIEGQQADKSPGSTQPKDAAEGAGPS